MPRVSGCFHLCRRRRGLRQTNEDGSNAALVSLSQPVSRSACQLVSFSACQLVSFSACQLVSFSAGERVCPSARQLVSASACQRVCRSARQPVERVKHYALQRGTWRYALLCQGGF